MTKFYRIGEFSKLTSVTVRTLHHYDKIGLLKPTGKTEARHRLYSETDLLRLQQISTLKFMGFSLEKVKKILFGIDLKNSLKIQAQMLIAESERMQQAARLIEYLDKSLETNQQVDWKLVANIIEVMKMSESTRKEWEAKFLNAEEYQSYQKLVNSRSAVEWEGYHQKWLVLLEDVKSNLQDDPASYKSQELAEKWMNLVDEIYADYPELKDKMWEAIKAEIMPKDDFPYTREVIVFIQKAVEIMYARK